MDRAQALLRRLACGAVVVGLHLGNWSWHRRVNERSTRLDRWFLTPACLGRLKNQPHLLAHAHACHLLPWHFSAIRRLTLELLRVVGADRILELTWRLVVDQLGVFERHELFLGVVWPWRGELLDF